MLRRKRVLGQKGAGIDNQKQKPVILHLAARDRRPGEGGLRPGLRRPVHRIVKLSGHEQDGYKVCFGIEGGPRPERVSTALYLDTNSRFRWRPGRRRWRPHHDAHFTNLSEC